MPYERFPAIRSMRVVVRSTGAAGSVARGVRDALAQADSTLPAYEFQTLEQALAESIGPRRFQMALLEVFAGAALLLALIGIHGVMAWSVSQRTRELGVRIALGAGRQEIVRLVVAQGMRLAGIGIAIGLLGAFGLTRWMTSLLYQVKANDAGTFTAVAGGMALAALAACCAPALRAARVDPAIALRSE
jgi:ABC-type antimicrobial peptide transport system permease subunit